MGQQKESSSIPKSHQSPDSRHLNTLSEATPEQLAAFEEEMTEQFKVSQQALLKQLKSFRDEIHSSSEESQLKTLELFESFYEKIEQNTEKVHRCEEVLKRLDEKFNALSAAQVSQRTQVCEIKHQLKLLVETVAGVQGVPADSKDAIFTQLELIHDMP
ncbi:hypothetical protein DSO57_1035321 [Entomophthora muscae]|uniref:Uncharacterized protein n=1 Tax=Entomophthora muscae TaxID=34485 RepID=A0ACC2T0I8_9FUNG|nr:hypothetical protein DSO57_1035321 [Entomophthora muscae]